MHYCFLEFYLNDLTSFFLPTTNSSHYFVQTIRLSVRTQLHRNAIFTIIMSTACFFRPGELTHCPLRLYSPVTLLWPSINGFAVCRNCFNWLFSCLSCATSSFTCSSKKKKKKRELVQRYILFSLV